MRRPGVEPGPRAWKARILTVILSARLLQVFHITPACLHSNFLNKYFDFFFVKTFSRNEHIYWLLMMGLDEHKTYGLLDRCSTDWVTRADDNDNDIQTKSGEQYNYFAQNETKKPNHNWNLGSDGVHHQKERRVMSCNHHPSKCSFWKKTVWGEMESKSELLLSTVQFQFFVSFCAK